MGEMIVIKRDEKIADMLEELEFFEYSYCGGREYLDEDYLIKHERESETSYIRRKKQAVLTNHCAQVVDLYNSHLFRAGVSRDFGSLSTSQLFNNFLSNADNLGNSYEQSIKAISKQGSIKGIFGVIVEKPVSTASSKQDEIDNDIRPYLVYIEPESMLYFKVEKINGKPILIEFAYETNEGCRIWTPEEVSDFIRVENTKDAYFFKESMPNALGKIPFVLHKNIASMDMFESMSDIADLAYIQRSMFNLDSQAQEIINRTGFPLMEVPESAVVDRQSQSGTPLIAGQSTNDSDIEVGTGNAVVREHGDTVGYRYIEPSHTSLPHILEYRRELRDDFNRIARVSHASAQQSNSAMSGVALEIEFQQLNALLADKGEQMEETEMAILKLFAEWMDEVFDGSIQYPDSFGVRDLSHDITMAINAIAVVQSATFKQQAAIDIASRMLPDADQGTIDKIASELNAVDISSMIDSQA